MRIETTDPITGHDVTPPIETHPFVVEGTGEGALKIYFDDQESKRAYLEIEVEHPGSDFETNLDNPVGMGPGDRR